MKVFRKTLAILLVTIVALVAVPLEVQADCVTKTATFKRLSGAGGYSNLPAITKEGWKTTGGTVVIATGEGFHDALSVAGAAGLEKAPILLTNGKKLSPETKAELKRLKPKKVIVAGGEKAITKKCFNEIKSASGAKSVKRIWGQTAPKTAVNLNLEYKDKWKKIAFLATMNGWEDSVSASPVSYALNYPIFLTEKNLSVSKNTINAMKKCGIKEIVILGGTKAIPNSTRDQLKKAGFTVKTRLWGKTAIETSEAVAKWAISKGMTVKNMGVAGMTGHREALTGAALCGRNNSVLVLTKKNTAKNTALAKSNKTKIKRGYVFGGADIVSKKVYNSFVDATKYKMHDYKAKYKTVHHPAEYKTKSVPYTEVEYYVGVVCECGATFNNYDECENHYKSLLSGICPDTPGLTFLEASNSVTYFDAYLKHFNHNSSGSIDLTREVTKYRDEQVVVKKAWNEKVVDYYICSCGAKK